MSTLGDLLFIGIRACLIALEMIPDGFRILGVAEIPGDWDVVTSSTSALLHDSSIVGGTTVFYQRIPLQVHLQPYFLQVLLP